MKTVKCRCGIGIGDLVTVPGGSVIRFGRDDSRMEIEPHDVCTVGASFMEGSKHIIALDSPHIRHHEISCHFVRRAKPVFLTLVLDRAHVSALFDALGAWAESEIESEFEWRHDAARALARALGVAVGAPDVAKLEEEARARTHHKKLWDAP